jgi:hypothetical protein
MQAIREQRLTFRLVLRSIGHDWFRPILNVRSVLVSGMRPRTEGDNGRRSRSGSRKAAPADIGPQARRPVLVRGPPLRAGSAGSESLGAIVQSRLSSTYRIEPPVSIPHWNPMRGGRIGGFPAAAWMQRTPISKRGRLSEDTNPDTSKSTRLRTPGQQLSRGSLEPSRPLGRGCGQVSGLEPVEARPAPDGTQFDASVGSTQAISDHLTSVWRADARSRLGGLALPSPQSP